MKKYYLGVDVGKHEHQASLIDEQEKLIGNSIRFKNNIESFQDWMRKIKKSLPKKAEIKAGMESTGHYWINLNNFLQDNGIKNIQIINPIETQQISKTRIRKVKNDKVDSLAIAKIISHKKEECLLEDEKIVKLKRLTRFYDKIKKQEKFLKREINTLLELFCPEFEGLFKNMFLKTPMAILRNYQDLKHLRDVEVNEFYEFLRKESRGRIKEDRAKLILETLQNSIGQKHWDDFAALQLRMLLDNFELIERQIIELKKEIEVFSDQFEEKKYIASIPGVSSISAAIYLSEIGNVNRFQTKHRLTAFAGIDASVFESGNYKRKQGNRISKRGSKYLRKQLYYAAKTASIFDPELKRFYEKKKSEGKHYNVIMIAVARKILMRIYAVMKQKRLYEVRS
jgi:transposase